MMSPSKCFFFQAEDGIRHRSPSRGLGDVYKRQISICANFVNIFLQISRFHSDFGKDSLFHRPYLSNSSAFSTLLNVLSRGPVSYTRLTLPTKRIVGISVVAVILKKKKN